MAVSLLAKLWTCDQQDILYILFIRDTMSIYCVLGGFVGTYSEDKQDYRLFCPDEWYQLFHDASTDLARSIKQMRLPTQYKRGKAASMRRELNAVAKAITNLSPESANVLKDREVDFINRSWGNCDELINPHIDDGARDFQRMSIWLDIDHSQKRLLDFAAMGYDGRAQDPRLFSLYHQAALRWEMHGGRVTDAEGDRTFPAYLEALLADAQLKASARVLTKKYLAQT